MNYELSDLIAIPEIQTLMDSLWNASGIPVGLLSTDGEILLASGWERICIQFHRRHPLTLERCRQSDTYINQHFQQGTLPPCGYIEYRCGNGMIDIALPLIIEDRHLANAFFGQFFYEPPDEDFFRQQARECGFDEEEYVTALKEVPLFSRQKVGAILEFKKKLVNLLAGMGLQTLQHLEMHQTLQYSEERLSLALQFSNEGVWDINLLTQEAYFSPRWFTMLGYEPGDLPGTLETWLELLHPEDRPPAERHWRTCVANGKEFVQEFRLRCKSGQYAHILSRGQAVFSPGQERPRRMVGTHMDLTSRKLVEEALTFALQEAESSHEKIDAIIKSVADGLVVADLDGRVTLMNPAAETFLRTTLAQSLFRPFSQVLDQPGVSDRISACISLGEEQAPVEWAEKTSQPTKRIFEAKTAPVRNAEGLLTGTITLLRDVTRERMLDKMKDEFISIAAHELRTPLTSILGFSEILLSTDEYGELDKERNREFLTTIHSKAEALSRIIDDLLDLGRIQAGKPIPLRQAPCRLGPPLQKLISNYGLLTNAHCFELQMVEDPEVCADLAKIEQVLENLLSNAVKFSPSGGLIRVETRSTARTLVVTVTDQGIGMTSQEQRRIFQKFYRADTSNTAPQGMGIGMTIARTIIKGHGGDIGIESSPGEGTKVFFDLPLWQDCRQSESIQIHQGT